MHDEYVYRERQMGWLLIVLLLGSALAALAIVPRDAPAWPAWLTVGGMLVLGLALGSLTVEVGAGELRWCYGWLGWPRWRVALADVQSIERCSTAGSLGWGILFTSEGMLYNIAGHEALRVKLHNGRSFRLGSANVAGLVRVLEPRLQR